MRSLREVTLGVCGKIRYDRQPGIRLVLAVTFLPDIDVLCRQVTAGSLYVLSTILCPNGHALRLEDVQTVQKSQKADDLGKMKCPFCAATWCACAIHGRYYGPPPCPLKH